MTTKYRQVSDLQIHTHMPRTLTTRHQYNIITLLSEGTINFGNTDSLPPTDNIISRRAVLIEEVPSEIPSYPIHFWTLLQPFPDGDMQ